MSYEVYKVIHLLGLAGLLAALGAAAAAGATGRPREDNALRGPIAAVHGAGLILMLVAGFGLLAKLGLTASIPAWVWLKLVVWGALAAGLTLAYKSPAAARAVFFALPVLAGLAAWLAVAKPGSAAVRLRTQRVETTQIDGPMAGPGERSHASRTARH